MNISESTKPGVNITMLLVEESKWKLQLQFGHLADLALPSELCALVSCTDCFLTMSLLAPTFVIC